MTRKAVLCGINSYANAPLKGCVNDARNVQDLLLNNYSFLPEEIHLLEDEWVVKAELLRQWDWLTTGAQPGDILVFHFSGHGSYVPDESGEHPDMRDEITCLQDMNFNDPATYLTDDEWYELAQQVDSAVQLIILKDTCHSGGSARFIGVRSDDGQERVVLANPGELRGRGAYDPVPESSISKARFLVPPQAAARAWRGEVGATRPTRLAAVPQTSLMACMEKQTAADAPIAGDFHGAFTYHFCQVLRGNAELSSRAAIEAVAKQLQGQFDQVPQHEGREVAAPIFGDGALGETDTYSNIDSAASSKASESDIPGPVPTSWSDRDAGAQRPLPMAISSRPSRSFLIRRPGQSQLFREVLEEGVFLEMVWIPPGRFWMGSPPEEPGREVSEGRQHLVQLQGFFLARTPITQAQWRTVASWQPEKGAPRWDRELEPEPSSLFHGDEWPVAEVNWFHAMEFCRRLRQRTGRNYTLPSEAQWEYACRAGTTTPFHFGATISTQLASYDGSKAYAQGPTGAARSESSRVATYPANDWGLHDMHGNVWEWCLDHWHPTYQGAPEDGSAWIDAQAQENPYRLLRGGSWFGDPRLCRSAYRNDGHPGLAYSFIGFRVCCLPQDQLLDP